MPTVMAGKAALTLSVSLMCAGSLLIAVTPGYETIGVAAPLLLVLARLVQGLSIGGEYGASATYLSEMAGSRRRGFYSSFQYVTLIAGQLLALCVLLLLQRFLTEAQLDGWGWRIPFLIGGRPCHHRLLATPRPGGNAKLCRRTGAGRAQVRPCRTYHQASA